MSESALAKFSEYILAGQVFLLDDHFLRGKAAIRVRISKIAEISLAGNAENLGQNPGIAV